MSVNSYLAIWAAIGPLAGISLGHFLTRSWQHKQWLRDVRKEEFKELITAMSDATVGLLLYKHSLGSPFAQSPQSYLDSMRAVYTCIKDRIYIAEDIDALDSGKRFMALSEELRQKDDYDEAADKLDVLIDELVDLARRA